MKSIYINRDAKYTNGFAVCAKYIFDTTVNFCNFVFTMNKDTAIDPHTALEKMKNWCAYQERHQMEARERMREMELVPETMENILSVLISENFINEERYACAYTRGKFRIKKWGRIKIKSGMRQKKISEFSIQKGMKEIDEQDYLETLKKLLKAKAVGLKSDDNAIKRNFKLVRFAQSRGFESDLIMDVLKTLE